MADDLFTITNLTASDVTIDDVGVVIPASGSDTYDTTEPRLVRDLALSKKLRTLVQAGTLSVTDFQGTYTTSATVDGPLLNYWLTGTSENVIDTSHVSVRKIRETSGPTILDMAGVADGTFLKRSGSTIIGVTVTTVDHVDVNFGRGSPVPSAGFLQLYGPGQNLQGQRQPQARTLLGASIQVDAVDATRAYKLSIRKNGVEVALLSLPISTIGAHTVALSIAFAAGDYVTLWVAKTSGAGASTFSDVNALAEFSIP